VTITEELKGELAAIVGNTIKTPEEYENIRRVLRRQAQQDFWFFCRHVCEFVDIDNEFHHEFCNRYQKRTDKSFAIYLMPRGHLKTTIMTVGGTLWLLIQDWVTQPNGKKIRGQDLTFLIGNATLQNAIDILADIKSIVTTSVLFRWLFPEYVPSESWMRGKGVGKWTNSRIDFPCSRQAGRKEGNITIVSTGASLVSKHYHVIKLDDVVNDENITTKILRDKTMQWYKDLLQLRVDPSSSRVELIGTRWHYDDLYGRLIRKELDRRKRAKDNGEVVKPTYVIYRRKAIEHDKPIWSERFTKAELHRLKYEELGAYSYSCQYDNEPIPEEDAKFKRNHIKLIDSLDIPNNVVNFMAVDMADEDTTMGDNYALTVASFDSLGKMYVREIIRGKFSQFEFLEIIYKMRMKWDVKRVGIETTSFQKGILRGYKAMVATKKWQIPWVEISRGKTSKFTRTIGFQPRVERGDFYIENDIPNIEWAIEEMITFPKGVFDDILDTFVDIENIYYGASENLIEAVVDANTFDSLVGKLSDLTEDEFDGDPLSLSALLT
jgi:predicted phage terminase large subunit-like protein